MHYPGKHDNDSKPNEELHKDKVVWNHPAGSIEFVNTSDTESITITHKSGSFSRKDKFGTEELTTRDKRENILGDSTLSILGSKTELIDETSEKIILGDEISKIGDVDKWQKPMEDIKKEQRELHDLKRLFEIKRTNKHNSIDQAPGQSKAGSPADCPTDKNESKILLTDTPSVVTLAENKIPRTIMEIEDVEESYKTIIGGGDDRCLTCWGALLSPSTQDGKWSDEGLKQQIVQKRIDIQKKIYESEKHLGQNKHPEGGSSIQTIAKNFIENIGLVFNDFESFRKDPKGKLVPYGIKIDPLGTTIYTQYRETSLIEHVNVEKFPGGSYDLNICDGWKVTVGSNGIDFKTTGPLNIYGTLVNILGEQITMNSRGELSLGGERVDISGDVITLRPRKTSRKLETGPVTEDEQQVLVDGNLNVGINAIIRGGLHVEGELTTHHITAPCEYQITESDFVWGKQIPPTDFGQCLGGLNGIKDNRHAEECSGPLDKSPTYATLLPGAKIGYAIGVDSNGDSHCLDVYSLESPNFAIVDPHFHYFKNVPLKLFSQNSDAEVSAGVIQGAGNANPHDAVRAAGARNNWPTPVLAHKTQNSKSEFDVVEKFGGNGCEPLVINKTDWIEPCVADSLPPGEGVRTSQYTDSVLKTRVDEIEKLLETKYKEIQNIMNTLSELKAKF